MFCNKCGTQIEESNQYCGNCGSRVQQGTLPIQAVETNFNFCRSCGAAVQGRYCEACGESSVKVEAKIKSGFKTMEQLKQTGASVKNVLPGKEALKNIKLDKLNFEKLTIAEAVKWVKQGLLFSVIVVAIAIVLSLLIGTGVKSAIFESQYSGYTFESALEKNLFNTVCNLSLVTYSMLFGGKVNWVLSVGGIKGTVAAAFPFVGIILGVIVLIISEKIRLKLSSKERTLSGNGIIAAITGVVVTLGGMLLNKSVRTNYRELYGYSYGSGSPEDIFKVGSGIQLLFSFFMVFMITFFTLQIIIKSKGVNEQSPILTIIRKLIFIVVGFAFVMATSVMIKVLMEVGEMPEGASLLAVLVGILYLIGIFISVILMGRFDLIEVVVNSDSVIKLKMTLANIKYEMYGVEEQMSNFMKWWLIVAVIITTCMILAAAYQFFKDRDLELKVAFKESALVSLGLGFCFGMVSKMAGYVMSVNLQATNSYYRDMLEMDRGKYSFVLKSGNSSLIVNAMIIAAITCILFMVMYWLLSLKVPVVDTIMNIFKPVVLWITVGVFCVFFVVKFDVYDINYSIMGIAEDAVDYIGEELENNFFDMFDF